VDEAMGIASQFLPEGTTVLVEEDRDGNRVTTETTFEGAGQDIPLIVLVNFNTASSSEIISGALQDHERALVVGTQTVGTGTVLSTYRLNEGGQLLLGTSQWLTPDGRLIRREGITPDVEVTLPLEAEQLTPQSARDLSDTEVLESEDVQLLEAIDMLKAELAEQE
jgi:carboxyl-terminal processing protease